MTRTQHDTKGYKGKKEIEAEKANIRRREKKNMSSSNKQEQFSVSTCGYEDIKQVGIIVVVMVMVVMLVVVAICRLI